MREALGGMRIWQWVEVLVWTDLMTLQQSLLLICSDYLPDHHHVPGSILGTGEKALHKISKVSIFLDSYKKERVQKEGREKQI